MRYILLLSIVFLGGCSNPKGLVSVTVADFQVFVSESGYITDAEKFGWSIHQITVHEWVIEDSLTWRNPSGKGMPPLSHPVTQVSYNDASAYAEWSGTTLPSYQVYWEMVHLDDRPINVSGSGVLPATQTNFVGNVWEITIPDTTGQIRLAGGSYLCNENTCNGSSPDRVLHVDQFTGNSHISFCVVK